MEHLMSNMLNIIFILVIGGMGVLVLSLISLMIHLVMKEFK